MPVPPHPRRAEADTLLREGKTPTEVARSTGAALRTVQAWARQIGLARPVGERGQGREPSPRVQEAISRLIGGDQVPQIAADLEITEAAVRQIRARFPVAEEEKCA